MNLHHQIDAGIGAKCFARCLDVLRGDLLRLEFLGETLRHCLDGRSEALRSGPEVAEHVMRLSIDGCDLNESGSRKFR